MALCDRNSHASAMPCWSVCHCECAQIAFSLRSYILCKQENYRSFLTSEHSPCLLCCTVQAEWGLSIKGSPPPLPRIQDRAEMPPSPWRREGGRNLAHSFIPPSFFPLHSGMCSKAAACFSGGHIWETLWIGHGPAKPAVPYGGQCQKLSLLFRGQIIQ